MQTLAAANSYYEQQQAIAVAASLNVKKLWRGMSSDFDSSWASVAPKVLETVHLARAAAVATSVGYTPAVLAETGQVAPPSGLLVPSRFLASAPNGLQMDEVLSGAVVRTKVAVRNGHSTARALEQGGSWLTGVVLTVMADTGRSVVGADIAQRPNLSGYVRMLNAPSCSRCVILAGRYFRWNAGFQRHPRCDCRHIPASENIAGDLRTDPYEYFKSLSRDEQDKMFRPHGVSRERAAQVGKSNARAIRDGGDLFRIENVRLRGLATAKGNLRYGAPSRMTVDDIYRTAGHRANAIRMMEAEGYITKAGQVPTGALIGQREGFGALGKGGKARAASNAVLDARAAGVRDPLNRYTMTSAERRLYDAKARLDVGRTGVWPRSIGENSADKYTKARAITPGELATLQKTLNNELSRMNGNPLLGIAPDESVKRLARLLGLV